MKTILSTKSRYFLTVLFGGILLYLPFIVAQGGRSQNFDFANNLNHKILVNTGHAKSTSSGTKAMPYTLLEFGNGTVWLQITPQENTPDLNWQSLSARASIKVLGGTGACGLPDNPSIASRFALVQNNKTYAYSLQKTIVEKRQGATTIQLVEANSWDFGLLNSQGGVHRDIHPDFTNNDLKLAVLVGVSTRGTMCTRQFALENLNLEVHSFPSITTMYILALFITTLALLAILRHIASKPTKSN